MMVSMCLLALHHVDVFDVNRAAVAEETHKDRKTNRSLGGGHGQDEQREHLPREIAQIGRKGDKVDVHRQQHQLDGHQAG